MDRSEQVWTRTVWQIHYVLDPYASVLQDDERILHPLIWLRAQSRLTKPKTHFIQNKKSLVGHGAMLLGLQALVVGATCRHPVTISPSQRLVLAPKPTKKISKTNMDACVLGELTPTENQFNFWSENSSVQNSKIDRSDCWPRVAGHGRQWLIFASSGSAAAGKMP